MKKVSILIASFLISIQLVAQKSELKASLNSKSQFDSINLNAYKQANYKQTTMGVGFGLNGGSLIDFKSSNSYQNRAFTNGSFSYTKIRSSRDYVGSQRLSFYYGSGYSNEDRETSLTSTNNFNYGLNATTNNRLYLPGNFFLNLNLNVFSSQYYNLDESNFDSLERIRTYNHFQTSSIGSIQFGKGRIENVTDARLAIYILDDLLKHGRLARVPNEGEVFEFADFITQTLNKRVIDDRIKQIMEYVAVDSFLVSKGLTTKSDGLGFGLISDNWRYARLQNWFTGHTWSFGISPTIDYGNSLNKTDENNINITNLRDEYTNYGIGINAGYNSYWIKGLKRRDGFNFNGAFNLHWNNHIPNEIKSYQSISASVGYERNYIPNTRTYITGIASLWAKKYFNDNNDNNPEINPTISGGCNYYFSEKVRLSVSSSLYYRFSKEHDIYIDIDRKHLQFNLGASLSYYIF
jgi:hypothetical protein